MMKSWLDFFAPLIGRILMGGFFLWSGIIGTLNFPDTSLSLQSAHVPQPIIFTAVIIGFEVVGGIFLIVGYKLRPSTLLLALFVISVSLLQFTIASGFDQGVLLDRMAIIGGLLYMAGNEKLRR